MKSTSPLIPVAVSACLLGWKVRYDGRDKHYVGIEDLLQGMMLPVPVCPEVAVGLGVPRPPIELVEVDGGVRALGVEDRNCDVTASLTQYARQVAAQRPPIAGMICKSRSPSCGLEVMLHDIRGGELSEKVEGRFVHALMAFLPGLPLIEEKDIDDDLKWHEFLEAVSVYRSD